MSTPNHYAMLIASLPYHGPLFGARRTPLSRIRLRQRLALLREDHAACLQCMTDLLDWSRQGIERTDEALVARAKVVVPALCNDMARELVVWRLEMRTVLAALRRRRSGQASPGQLRQWGYGRWLVQIREHWNDPHFRLERALPWLPEARTLLEQGDALGLERLLLATVWEHLDRLGVGHHFDFEAVLIYALRWDLIARWTSYDGEAALARFDTMVESGLAAPPRTVEAA